MNAEQWRRCQQTQSLHGLRRTDLALADVLQRQHAQADPLVLAGAALASWAVAQGHAAFDPAQPGLAPADLPGAWPETAAWLHAWQGSPWIDDPSDPRAPSDPACPLVVEHGLLWLRRYREYEATLASDLRRLVAAPAHWVDQSSLDALAPLFRALFAQADPQDRQARAAALGLLQPLLLVSGGPGTGKTTTIARMLLLRIALAALQGRAPLRIALAAPTGRAAERMGASLHATLAALPADAGIDPAWLSTLPTAGTVHRLLGLSSAHPVPRHDRTAPLPFDVVVVDEASMLDLPLMAKLAAAIADGAQLILLGDPDQLPPVEAGNVLAAIVEAIGEDADGFPPRLADRLQDLIVLPRRAAPTAAAPLAGHGVTLQVSHRPLPELHLQPLADAVRTGDADRALDLLQSGTLRGVEWIADARDPLAHPAFAPCWQVWRALGDCRDPADALQRAAQARLLTALRHGPHGTQVLNERIGMQLAGPAWHTLFPGRLLAIRDNHPRLGLFNGDVGICLPDGSGMLRAWFLQQGRPEAFDVHALPAHELAFASTVHKAQGAEHADVWVWLPPHDSRILSRELLYTAITRARRSLVVFASADALRTAIGRSHRRVSALAWRLRAAPATDT